MLMEELKTRRMCERKVRSSHKAGQVSLASPCKDINQTLDHFINFGFFNITYHNNVNLEWIVMDPFINPAVSSFENILYKCKLVKLSKL